MQKDVVSTDSSFGGIGSLPILQDMEETPTLVIHGDTRGPWDIPRITGRILCMVKSCNCGLVQKTVEDNSGYWIRTKQVHFQKCLLVL